MANAYGDGGFDVLKALHHKGRVRGRLARRLGDLGHLVVFVYGVLDGMCWWKAR